ncbi:DUF5134 domain-containing protein [Microbacterium sp. NPDC078428]|uniref:DUF5134 domain-containing protein n=1 Tax=Microbacterium sp. NPDC078428 TaxID=3364190 RepID=UPI0037C6BD8F
MLTSPWDLILTVLFAITGTWCAADLISHRAQSRTSDGSISQHTIVDINHLVMSAAMILMIWVIVIDAVTWAQVAVFGIFALALLPGMFGATHGARRVSLLGHIVLNAAMIWMLLAMPLLMAGLTAGDGASSGHHHGGEAAALPTSTPIWADVVNWLFVALSAGAALWWIVTLLRSRGRHLHDVCYAGMAAGMAVMLVVMNA